MDTNSDNDQTKQDNGREVCFSIWLVWVCVIDSFRSFDTESDEEEEEEVIIRLTSKNPQAINSFVKFDMTKE